MKNNPLKEKYILPEIYIPRKGERNNPDLTKNWCVYYSFQNPKTEKMQTFKIYKGINQHESVALRLQAAKVVKEAYTLLLIEENFNPFFSRNELKNASQLLRTSVEMYLKALPGKVVDSTISIRKSRLEHLIKYGEKLFTQKCTINQIKGAHITDLITQLEKKGVINTGKTANLYKTDYSSFFNHFLKKEDQTILKGNPTVFVEAKPEESNANRPFSDKEFKAILDYTKEHLPYMNLMFRFLYYTCLRPRKEARMLQVKDIIIDSRTPENSRIRIRNSKTARYFGGEDQFIPLDPILLKIITEEMQIDRYNPEAYLFTAKGTPGPKAISFNYWNDYIKKIREAGLMHEDQTMYSTKHTRVCNLVEDGESMARIIKLTRHRDFASLQDYLKGFGFAMEENPVYNSRQI